MTRFKPMIIGALGLGAAALVSTGASAQVRHGGWHGGGGYHGAYYGGGGGWYGGHHGGGWGNGFFPAALAIGALTGAISAVAGGPDYGYGSPGGYYPGYAAYPMAYPYPAYPYPAYGAYPITYAPAPYYYGRPVHGPRRFAGAYHRRMHIGGHRGVMRVGYRGHR